MDVSLWDNVLHTFMISIRRWPLTSRSNLKGFWHVFCPVHNYLLIWHWLTIFGICVNHHEKMCRVHSWSLFYLELWPKCQIYGFFSCLCVRPIISVCFDIGIPYLAHMSITMRTCVAFIHDPDRKWPLTSGPIYRVYNMVLCLGHSFFVLWQSHIMHVSLTPWYNVLRTFITSIWPWHLTSISKFEFSPRTEVWLDVLTHWNRHTNVWYMSVLPWDKMLCTFLTFVWPLHLTICLWQGVSLVSFTDSFISSPEPKAQVSFSNHNLSVVCHRCHCRS